MQQRTKRPAGEVYYSIPGYRRPVFARWGDSFDVSAYSIWGAVFVTVPPEMNATAAVEKALQLADSVAVESEKFKENASAKSEPP